MATQYNPFTRNIDYLSGDSSPLNVNSDASSSLPVALPFKLATTDNPTINLQNDGVDKWVIYSDKEDSDKFKIDSATVNALTITQDGTSTLTNIHVDGDITNYNSTLTDIGAIQTSDKYGYGKTYLSNKTIANSKFGRSGLAQDGGFRIRTQEDGYVRTEFYLGGSWKTVLTGVNIVTDGSEYPKDIEFTDFAPWYLSLITGDSDAKDIKGLPYIQQMTSCIGAYQRQQTLNGGTF